MSGAPDPARGHGFVAVDLGATSGRVVLAVLTGGPGDERIDLTEVGRFTNGPVEVPTADGTALHWDLLHLWRGTLDGLRAAGVLARERGVDVAAVGIDSWAVDYGAVAADGILLGHLRHHRDPRLTGVADEVLDRLGAADHYAVNGLQTLPFNTEFQIVAGRHDPTWPLTASVRLVPDLVASWLTGQVVAEVTNASTTGLVDATTRQWSLPVIEALQTAYPELGDLRSRLADLVEPGTVVGPLTPAVQAATGLGAVPVVAVGSHDTASAVVGVPAEGERFAYVSSGTWSLVGLELDAPVLTEDSRRADVTNELGVDGTVRYLKNVMGLWVLSETLRTWREAGREVTLDEALAAAAEAAPRRTVVDLDAWEFLPPGDMPARIAAAAAATGQPVPDGVGQVVRCILDSLADAYRRVLAEVTRLAGREVDVLHVVGGGSQNVLLCRLTAEATGLPVVAGPVEGAALGNVVVQARAVGALHGDLTALRRVVRRSAHVERYLPAAVR
ncbi:rhamnulokinase [Isoptericola jiangsuensis]|uniref:Rhamnulokinase n=1 Tax=Isoptericola jiangsuensis TaxID=548579 RepID=A0A2A9EUP4_9MICO|nr:rhamnulokinase family protein [Isoptericola jiangsuensis]PFG42002.1 rhamnulokinase [Isoptericola jiangsuensis]